MIHAFTALGPRVDRAEGVVTSGPSDAAAEQLLRRHGIHRHIPMPEEEVNQFIDEFIAGWRRNNPEAAAPTREAVRSMMEARDKSMVGAWNRVLRSIAPKIAIGSFVSVRSYPSLTDSPGGCSSGA